MEDLIDILKSLNLEIISHHSGHIIQYGKYFNKERNPYCIVKNSLDENEKIFCAMHCYGKKIFYFSLDKLEIVLCNSAGGYQTWSLHPNQKLIYSPRNKNNKYIIYLHHLIMNIKKPAKYLVRHRNGNKLDNRNSNLKYIPPSIKKKNFYDKIPKIETTEIIPEIELPEKIPLYFREWFAKKYTKFPDYCYYNDEEKYFSIKNHPSLLENGIEEIRSSIIKNLIEKYEEIQRAINFLDTLQKNHFTFWKLEDVERVMKNIYKLVPYLDYI